MPDEHWRRLELLSTRAFKSGVLPASVKSEAAAFTIALKGLALGLDPLYAMEHIALINGKATIDGQAMLALIYKSGDIEVVFHDSKNPSEECTVTMKRRGVSLTVTWTLERARKAGLLGSVAWQKYPDQMLRWRCVSECGRVIAPDRIAGLYLHEEMGATNVGQSGEIIEAEFKVSQERPPETAAPGPKVAITEENESTLEVTTSGDALAGRGAAENLPSEGGGTPSDAIATPPPPSKKHEISKGQTPIDREQQKLLFATMRDCGWNEERLKMHLDVEYGITSTKNLLSTDLSKVLKHMEANKAAT